MSWVLLMVAIGGPPVQLGQYATEPACTKAIRTIFQMQNNPANIQNPQLEKLLDRLVAVQREYRCVPTDK